ncbi:hypothetical protein E2C01_040675 [Portunus trituberculatus]|uniref:Uncharacterized protein n=1 Tax=Portunus trituberculatus TaxID=210409 RepID=A0A5B7FPE5_PORTR|nr:hypothetical protein [Portunus trituberculatus]
MERREGEGVREKEKKKWKSRKRRKEEEEDGDGDEMVAMFSVVRCCGSVQVVPLTHISCRRHWWW